MDDSHQLVAACKRLRLLSAMGPSKRVLMMPHGLATTHDPDGHNLPRATPAMCFLRSPAAFSSPAAHRAGIRDSASRAMRRCSKCQSSIATLFGMQSGPSYPSGCVRQYVSPNPLAFREKGRRLINSNICEHGRAESVCSICKLLINHGGNEGRARLSLIS